MICVNSVNVSPQSAIIQKGKWYYNAKAQVYPSNADCKSVRWHSQNTSIATVNASSGYIYAKAVGTTKIYATATDGSECSDYITVTVKSKIAVTSVTLNRSSLSLEAGECATLLATVSPSNATNKTVNWTSSNSNIAKVSSSGVVTAVAKGTAKITATAADGSGKSASRTVSVTEEILVSSICVSTDTNPIIVGKSAAFYATVCPANAENRCVAWSSDDPSIATINPLSGLVYAKKAGSTVIRATACDDSGVVGTYNLRVIDPICVEGITISPTSLTMNVGEEEHLCATICPENATDKSVVWTSSNPNVATVGLYTGIVEAVGPGEVTITATSVDGSYVDCCIAKVRKTYSQRDFEIMSIDDRALMSCLQIVYAYYEDIGDVKSIRRQDEILRKINEIREKAEYKNLYTACTNTDTPILPIKTTKINVQRLHTLTKNDIIEMHNKDSILVVLASLIPTIGAGFSVLMALVQEAEQNGNIDFLGLTIEQVISYLLEENKLKWLGKILTIVDLVNILSTENRETYVKDGCRMAEGDTMVEIRLDYDLGCENIVFHFVVRDNVPISCVKYGVTRVDRRVDGYYNAGYINRMKEEWINEGYIAD